MEAPTSPNPAAANVCAVGRAGQEGQPIEVKVRTKFSIEGRHKPAPSSQQPELLATNLQDALPPLCHQAPIVATAAELLLVGNRQQDHDAVAAGRRRRGVSAVWHVDIKVRVLHQLAWVGCGPPRLTPVL